MVTSKEAAAIEERRRKIYSLYLKKYPQIQIAQTLKIAVSTVNYNLRIMKNRNIEWFKQHRAADARLSAEFKEHRDSVSEIIAELWSLFYNSAPDPNAKEQQKDKTGLRIQILNSLLGAVRYFGTVSGLEARTVDDLEAMAAFEKLQQEITEYRQKQKVKPLYAPYVPEQA